MEDWIFSVNALLIFRTIAVACQGVVLFEAWSNRRKVSNAIEFLRGFFSSMTRPCDPRIERRVAEIRFDIFRKVANLGRLISLSVAMFACVTSAIKFENSLEYQAFGSLLAYMLLTHVSNCPHSILWIYICVGFTSANGIFIPFLTNRWLLGVSRRALLRFVFSAFSMDLRFTAIANFLPMLAECWAYHQQPLIDDSCRFFYVQTVITWVIIIVLCMLTKFCIKEYVVGEFVAKDSLHSMQRLLSALCDSVIELLPDLRIAQATPQLLHLLSPSTPLRSDTLHGTLFSDLLATDADKENFKKFVANTWQLPANPSEAMEGAATALRVNLCYTTGYDVSVELFHVHSEVCPEHLIGIRELRRDGIPPDESTFRTMTELASGSMHIPPSLVERNSALGRRHIRSSVRTSRSSRITPPLSQTAFSSTGSRRSLEGLGKKELALEMDFQISDFVVAQSRKSQE